MENSYSEKTALNEKTAFHEKTILGHPRGLLILFFTEMWERFSYYGMRGLLIVYLTQHFLFSDEKSSLIYGAYTALVYVMTVVGGSLADRYLGAKKAVTFGAILLTLGHFGMSFEGQGSRQLVSYNDSQYQIVLDGRGGDARQQIVTDQGISYISFSQTSMEIARPEAVGLPASIPRDQISVRVERESLYLNILYLSLALLIAGVGFLKANISTIVGSSTALATSGGIPVYHFIWVSILVLSWPRSSVAIWA